MNANSNKYALAALKDRRATLAGEIVALKRKIAWAEDQLAHLDHTIRLFDPAYQDGNVRPKKAYKRVKLFRQGELGRLILDALREAGSPLKTAEIVSAVMAAKGHGEEARTALGPRVRGNLAYLSRRAMVHKIGEGKAIQWDL